MRMTIQKSRGIPVNGQNCRSSLSRPLLCLLSPSAPTHTGKTLLTEITWNPQRGKLQIRSSFYLIPTSRLPLVSVISANAVRLPQHLHPRLPHIQINACTESTLLPQIHVDNERETPITKGTCARVAIGQVLLSVRCKDSNSHHAQEALRRAKFKFPDRQKIIVSRKCFLDATDPWPTVNLEEHSC